MPSSGACPFRSKWEIENERLTMMLLSAEQSAARQCLLPVARSWERCRDLGLFRKRSAGLELMPPEELKKLRDQHIFLLHLAAKELNVLRHAIRGAEGTVLLADPGGTILNEYGSQSFAGRAQSVALLPGATWSEGAEGTNAIGTALVEQQLVQIAGEQHFLEDNHSLICTAIPVMSPTGQVAGILDISGDIRNPPAHASMLIQLASARIEHSWVSLHGARDRLIAFHPHPNWLGTPQEGLIAFRDELMVAANPAALRLLGLEAVAINNIRWNDIFCNPFSYGQLELYPQQSSGMFYGSVRRPRSVTVAMPGVAEDAAPEILIQEGAIWDAAAIQMLTKARRAFEAGIPILLQGETGTGKEVFVRALQRLSSRAGAAFVPVNCAAIPEGLQEAEVFGYEEGAFTGARRQGSLGYIRRAEGGTLFLDEIGDMPPALQAQLLRVLQDGEVTPLGARRAIRVNFRLVAATHQDLPAAVAAGKFRADLYYRLRHMVFFLPPLRQRQNLPGILDAMLASLGGEARSIRLTTSARRRLLEHNWPGNLREMSNLLSALLALAEDGGWIDDGSLPPDVGTARAEKAASTKNPRRVTVAMPGVAEGAAPEILIQEGAIWDAAAIQMLTKARRAFEAGIPILLQGETGTGKEVFVRALQRLSSRAGAAFVPVNCAAIPEGLQEAEVFGYEEGAFTGARRQGSLGYIRRAEGGTLFLDEIGDMPPALQAQLLRVLQDGEVTPLGARRAIRVNFRLVAATHQDLPAAVAAGKFRADLYYRLRHMVFFLPPLRQRQNLPGILDAMLAALGGEARGIRLTASARRRLLEHNWPGNLREMSNLLSALLALAEDGGRIDVDSLPQDVGAARRTAEPEKEAPAGEQNELLLQIIRANGGNMSAAARQLGMHRSTLYRRLAHS